MAGAAGEAAQGIEQEGAMRMIVLAALVAIGIGLMATSPTMAVPANGSVLSQAAARNSPVAKVPCAWRRGRSVCW